MQARCVPIHSDSGLIHRNIIKMLCKVEQCLTSVRISFIILPTL